MKNMNDLVRQAQVMQNKMSKAEKELAQKLVEASAGGGMVKVSMTCKHEVKSVIIDPQLLETPDVEMLQDLILTAVNEAVRIGKEITDREMQNISGGIQLPGMF